MMNCLNCDEPALFVFKSPSVYPQPYCNAHLPTFMRPLAKAGMLETTDAYAGIKKSALDALSPKAPEPDPVPITRKKRGRKSSAAADEAPVDDQAPTDEEPDEIPAVAEENPESEPETAVAE